MSEETSLEETAIQILEASPGLSRWVGGGIAETALLIAIALIARALIVRAIEGKTDRLSDSRRRWISIVRNVSKLAILLGLIFIWSPQLSTFALSLTAFAVAMVIATKEYVLCMVGAVYRATARPFEVGDWIEVQGIRGEVIDEGMLTTKLQELGEGASEFELSGRVLTLPNSALLTQTVINESFRTKYLHHRFSVTVDPGIDPSHIADRVLSMLETCANEQDPVAERYLTMVQRRLKTDLPSREPQVTLETSNLGKIVFDVTVFCATERASKIENEVTRYVLSEAAILIKSGKAPINNED